MRPRASGPTVAVSAAALVLWLTTGVSLGDAGLFVGYHVLYVIAPGCAIYRLLRPGDASALRQLVLGWALGYVLEVLAFVTTAATDERGLLKLYPLVILALAVPLWRPRVGARQVGARRVGARRVGARRVGARRVGARRVGARREPAATLELPPGWGWAIAALSALALAFLGVEYFGSAPLPNQVGRVSYGIDTVWYLSIAGEALHHWPVGDPTVSGQPLYYHLFSSFDTAAITQVTGIGLPVVFFRLCMVPMVLLTVLGLALAGATFGRAWAGPLAVALALFVGELNLDPHVGYKFANEMGDDIVAISPSFLMGAALFAPLLALLCELAQADFRAIPRFSSVRSVFERSLWRELPYGTLAVFGVLAVGASGAKAPTITVLAGGLGLYLAWETLVKRRLHLPLLASLAVTAAVLAGFWLVAYGAAGSDQLTVHPPGVVRQMEVPAYFASRLGSQADWVPLWLALTVVGVIGAYGVQLIGVVGGGARRTRGAGLLMTLFAAGQLPYLVYTHPGLSQVFFAEYGLFAACLVSAEGLTALWEGAVRQRAVVASGVACVATAVAVAFALPHLLGLGGQAGRNTYVYADLALAGALTLAYALAAARRRFTTRHWAYVAAAALAIGATGRVLSVAAPTVNRLATDKPLYSQTGDGLTAGLYRALDWIRTHTSPSTVIAVNNFRDWSLYWSDGWAVPDDFYYSAFAQRPVFLEGWIYTQAATEAGNAVYYGRRLLFSSRLALDNAVFQWAHFDALRTVAQRYGVGYLLVDRVHNRANPRLGTIARLVFHDRDASVYAVPSDLEARTRVAVG
jgi:hypothetical protein